MEAKKVILKLDLHDDKDKQKAIKTVSKISGIDSIAMDMKAMKLTVVGDIDPVVVVNRLRKYWNASIFFVGPAKEPEKKKDDGKKDDGKKEGGGDKKKESNDHMAAYNPYVMPYYYNYPHHVVTYNPQMSYPQHATTHYPPMATPCYAQEENPNGCVIC